jgi:hypothetical protein|tara:strand:+ start:1752 stop:1976 length:225 start_codon:yes stop_codon:yes gene_type:complete
MTSGTHRAFSSRALQKKLTSATGFVQLFGDKIGLPRLIPGGTARFRSVISVRYVRPDVPLVVRRARRAYRAPSP